MVIMLEMLLRLRWFCRELETGALRQGDRSGGRQRWELGAAIVQTGQMILRVANISTFSACRHHT